MLLVGVSSNHVPIAIQDLELQSLLCRFFCQGVIDDGAGRGCLGCSGAAEASGSDAVCVAGFEQVRPCGSYMVGDLM